MEIYLRFLYLLTPSYLNTLVVVLQAVTELSLDAFLLQAFDFFGHTEVGIVLHTLLCA